ncbi:MAG: hypothetical protein KTR17_12740 [Cellvibrionaceae bacterium]|nr:hypothetical protein [Cellvibrionaceae bacterium]
MQITPDGGIVNTLGNIPESEITGAELELQALIAGNLFIAANFGIIDSEITTVSEENSALLGNELPLAEDINMSGMVR